MQRIWFLTLLAVALLTGVSGCGESYRSSSETVGFEVDGTQYIAGWHVSTDREGRVVLSFLTAYRPFYPMVLTFHSQFEKNCLPRCPNGEQVFAKTDMFYFIHDGQIVFEKEYKELGIDASRLNAAPEAILDYLRPILVKWIRENVPPQEPEMEEQPQ